MMMLHNPVNDLPPRQRQVLEKLCGFLSERGYAPSIVQLCELCGVSSTATMHYHLTTLRKKGLVQWNASERRAVTLTPIAQSFFADEETEDEDVLSFADKAAIGALPLLGRIVAGVPLAPASDTTETVNLLDTFCHDQAFLLQVSGESMIEDHIADGDLVLVRPNVPVRNGDVVVALVQGMETTLKRYEHKGNKVILHPANQSMTPIEVPADQVEIQGRVDAVIRQYR